MQLLDYVSISVSNLDNCIGFYDATMQALGCEKVYQTKTSLGYGIRCSAEDDKHTCLAVYESEGANVDEARHWCFKAASRDAVDQFYKVGLENDGRCNGTPGIRAHYHESYYGAFLYDPSGNRVEAVYHGG